MSNGIYIYGIIKAGNPQDFGCVGISEDHEASNVRTLEFADIAAVISKSPLRAYDSLTKEQTIKDLVTHQFVIEKVMGRFTIVPVKFGTMVENEAEALTFLEKGYALLSSELEKMDAKLELDVVASWTLPKILAEISQHDEQVQARQKEVVLKGAKASIEDKIMLGQTIEQALISEKARYHALLLQTLTKQAIDVRHHELATEEMIFNSAFLLNKQHEEVFNEAITLLDQALENRVNFRVVGPLPPYSFSTILFERIDPGKLEEAKKTLGLQGEVTHQTIRDAYRQWVQKYHPDKLGSEDASDFQLIHAAYQTLKNWVANGLMSVGVYRWDKDLTSMTP